MKEIYFDPATLTQISDSRQAEGLSACYEEMDDSGEYSDWAERILRSEINLLSRRQRQIMKLILFGLTDMEIAIKLKIKLCTVSNHKNVAINKLRNRMLNK